VAVSQAVLRWPFPPFNLFPAPLVIENMEDAPNRMSTADPWRLDFNHSAPNSLDSTQYSTCDEISLAPGLPGVHAAGWMKVISQPSD
jgi:hypothetical protein